MSQRRRERCNAAAHFHLEKDPGEGPNHPQKGTQYEVGGINEKNPTLTLLRFFQARQELFVERIKRKPLSKRV